MKLMPRRNRDSDIIRLCLFVLERREREKAEVFDQVCFLRTPLGKSSKLWKCQNRKGEEERERRHRIQHQSPQQCLWLWLWFWFLSFYAGDADVDACRRISNGNGVFCVIHFLNWWNCGVPVVCFGFVTWFRLQGLGHSLI